MQIYLIIVILNGNIFIIKINTAVESD